MKTLEIIPGHEEYLRAQLPEYLQRELNNIMDALARLANAASLWRECKMVAPGIGVSARALYERVRRHLRSGDWKDLVDKAKAGPLFYEEAGLNSLPVCTKEFVKSIFERFQRNNGAGLREIELILRTHLDSKGNYYQKIPGCDIWPVLDETPGWSRRNLKRMTPKNWEAKAARVGLFAASQFRPPVFKSRAELPFCHWVEFDDHEWNVKIHWPGQVKAMRPGGFAACERLSTFLKPSFKPTFWARICGKSRR